MGVLKSQSAIVTGASSGIGAGVALALAAAGARVCINYRTGEDEAEAIRREIIDGGGEALVTQADVSKEHDVKKLFATAVDAFGRVDIVVANSGIQKDAPFRDMSLADWEKVISTNLTGQFLCCREAVRCFSGQERAPNLSSARGKIICMSSVHEIIPWAGHANYAASKGGTLMMMKSLAQEVAREGIRVNGIAPGAIKTPINTSAWDTPEGEKKLLALIPYGRVGVVDDVAKAAVWLASDDSDYVVGTTLFVDGGMTLYPGFADNG
ncbi:MAG: glucose 1-dehydrogenase [Clostridia bacterium]|nr:glucose 1-dehydrogenase [Deltaproteobacteria bacterium]